MHTNKLQILAYSKDWLNYTSAKTYIYDWYNGETKSHFWIHKYINTMIRALMSMHVNRLSFCSRLIKAKRNNFKLYVLVPCVSISVLVSIYNWKQFKLIAWCLFKSKIDIVHIYTKKLINESVKLSFHTAKSY